MLNAARNIIFGEMCEGQVWTSEIWENMARRSASCLAECFQLATELLSKDCLTTIRNQCSIDRNCIASEATAVEIMPWAYCNSTFKLSASLSIQSSCDPGGACLALVLPPQWSIDHKAPKPATARRLGSATTVRRSWEIYVVDYCRRSTRDLKTHDTTRLRRGAYLNLLPDVLRMSFAAVQHNIWPETILREQSHENMKHITPVAGICHII